MGRYDILLETDQTPTRPTNAPSLPRQGEEISSLQENTASSLPLPQRLESKDNSINQPLSQSTGQSTSQPTEYKIDPPVRSPVEQSPILGRPKAFYITKRQDEALDGAVRKLSAKLEGVASLKVDRSTVIRALLDTTDMAGEATIEKLADTLVNQLVSRLTSRPVNQSHDTSIK